MSRQNPTPRRALVVGGSIGGLLVGNLLHRRGWQVDIVERSGEGLASRGAGLARHPGMDPVLRAAGVDPAGLGGYRTGARIAFDRDGRAFARYDYPQVLSSWGSLYTPLLAAFPRERYHLRRDVVGLGQDGDGVRARFADGSVVEADLAIGADGFGSTVRGLFAPDCQPHYSGYVAWRGLAEAADLTPDFGPEPFSLYAFCFPPAGMWVHYPLDGADGTEPLRRRHHFLWYRHTGRDGGLDDLLTDSEGRLHRPSIPPPLIRAEHIDTLKRDAAALLPAVYAAVVLRSRHFILQPIWDVESEAMAFGRVALLGDAAFVARPHVGIGVLRAAEDAMALVECLDGEVSVDGALRAYEARRRPAGQAAVRFARYLGGWIAEGTDQPASDPSLGLSVEIVISCSARPVAAGLASDLLRRDGRPEPAALRAVHAAAAPRAPLSSAAVL